MLGRGGGAFESESILAYRAVETLFCLNQRKSSIFTLTKFASAAPLARSKVHWSLMELSDQKDEPTESTPDFQLFKKKQRKTSWATNQTVSRKVISLGTQSRGGWDTFSSQQRWSDEGDGGPGEQLESWSCPEQKRSPLHYAGEGLLRELLHSRHKRAHLHLWGRGGVVLEGPILIYFSGRGGGALESESISAHQAVDTLFCHSSSSAVRASGICLWE